MDVIWYLQVLLSKTFELAFDEPPLRPEGCWVIPLCARELGDKRMYPHIHILYVLHYGGQFGIAVTLEQGGQGA